MGLNSEISSISLEYLRKIYSSVKSNGCIVDRVYISIFYDINHDIMVVRDDFGGSLDDSLMKVLALGLIKSLKNDNFVEDIGAIKLELSGVLLRNLDDIVNSGIRYMITDKEYYGGFDRVISIDSNSSLIKHNAYVDLFVPYFSKCIDMPDYNYLKDTLNNLCNKLGNVIGVNRSFNAIINDSNEVDLYTVDGPLGCFLNGCIEEDIEDSSKVELLKLKEFLLSDSNIKGIYWNSSNKVSKIKGYTKENKIYLVGIQ